MRRRPEARLERDILLELGPDPRIAIYRNEVGVGYRGALRPAMESALASWPAARAAALATMQRHRVTYGLGVGSPDLVCIGAGGAFVGGELKDPDGGRLRKEQAAWHAAARERGATVGVWRSIDDARRDLGI